MMMSQWEYEAIIHASMWMVCGTIEGETLILVCNDRLIINKLYRPQRFGFGLDDWYKAVKHSDDTFYISVPGRGGLEVLASIWCRGQTVRSCPLTNEKVHTKKLCELYVKLIFALDLLFKLDDRISSQL